MGAMFKGAIVAIVTPFKNGKVDERALRELIEFQISNGIDGIVPCGTTGESPVLSHEEHDRVIEITVDAVKKRVPVIAGTGSNSTEEALRLTKHAHEVGADAVLMVNPYYNRPTQEGLYQHYKYIAEKVPIPIIMYNIPSRTGVNMTPDTMARLAKIKNIVGVKEAAGSLQQMQEIMTACGPNFIVVSGDDWFTYPLMCLGGHGIISVIANIAPADVSALVDAFNAGDMKKAKELHYKMTPMVASLFIEVNPVPVKAALNLMGKIEYEVRLPLAKMSDANYEKLKKQMQAYGLIK
ncbi:MAG TPA: 4-hydroxy-tetrahydrodipicolinate synthase [Syntrophales bacterium]|nr:4-hydroxy-tetrahydrodipicolinate synthase [Syntrophales bacterium]